MTATIINYCTNDYRFLRPCIEAAQRFSDQIIIPVCSHLFDGVPENRDLLHQSYSEHPDVQFIEFAYDEKPYGHYSCLTPEDEDWSHYLHSTARYVGYQFVKECDQVLFLDVDEVVDQSFSVDEWHEYNAVRLPSYFYFREPVFRAIDCFPLNALLVRKAAIESSEMILDVLERKGLYDQIEGRKMVASKPLVHHYSWVRTEAELRQKVRTWGHRHDQNWTALIKKEFAEPFQGIDRIHRFQYETVDPLHDVLKEISYRKSPEIHFSHVVQVNRQKIFEMTVEQLLK